MTLFFPRCSCSLNSHILLLALCSWDSDFLSKVFECAVLSSWTITPTILEWHEQLLLSTHARKDTFPVALWTTLYFSVVASVIATLAPLWFFLGGGEITWLISVYTASLYILWRRGPCVFLLIIVSQHLAQCLAHFGRMECRMKGICTDGIFTLHVRKRKWFA